MAQLVLGTVGAVVGGLIGGPMGASIGWAIGGAVGSAIDPQKIEGPRLDDLKVTASAYGAPVPVIFGHPRVAGTVIWASDKREIKTTSRQGKGGGPETTNYTYEIDLLVLLSANEIQGVRRVWSNGKLVYSVAADSDEDTVDASEDGQVWRAMRVHTGAESQLPDPTYEAAVGTGNAPAYRGCGTVLIEGLDLGGGGQLPNLTFEIGTGVAPSAVKRVWDFVAGEAYVGTPTYGAANGSPRALYLAAPGQLRLHREGGGTIIHETPVGARLSAPATGNAAMPTVVMGSIANAPTVYVQMDDRSHRFDLLQEGDWVGASEIRYSISAAYIVTASIAEIGEGAGRYAGCVGALGRIYVWDRTNGQRIATIEHGSAVSSIAIMGSDIYALSGAVVSHYTMSELVGSFATAPGSDTVICPGGDGKLMCANQAGDVYVRDAGAWEQVGRLAFKEGDTVIDLGTHNAAYDMLRATAVTAVIKRTVQVPGETWALKWRDFIGTAHPGYETLGECVEAWMGIWAGSFTSSAGVRATRNASFQVLHIDPISDSEFWRARAFVRATIDRWYGYPDDTGPTGWIPLSMEVQFDQFEDEYYPTTRPVNMVEFYELSRVGRSAADPVPLTEAVQALCDMCGIHSVDVDVSELNGQMVEAMAVQPTAARGVLAQLATAYYFECVESDRLYFRRRGSAPVVTIPYADYGADGLLTLQDANDLERPAQVNVSYLNLANAYQQGNEVSDRLTTDSAAVSSIQLAIGMTPAAAKAIADTAVLDQTVAARTGSAALDLRYARLEPTDVVLLEDGHGLRHRARVVKVADAAGVRSLDVVADDARVLHELGITGDEYDDDYVVEPLARTDLVVLDIPILRDQDDNPGLYVAGDGLRGRWPGYALLRGGEEIGRSTTGAAMGAVAELLPDWDSLLVDERDILTVTVNPGDELVSITHADLATTTLNYAAIGAPGRWEIVQYTRAELVAQGVYRVSGLARGRLGTEHLRGTHAAGDRFVALDGAGLLRDVGNVADIATPRAYTGLTLGARIDDATQVQATPRWEGLRPLSPVGARQLKQGSGDIDLQWGRRSRYVSNVLMGVLPLAEASERYEVEILGSGGAVVRTLASTTPAVTYTAAQQVADFGAQRASVAARIYQLSASVGRGQPASI